MRDGLSRLPFGMEQVMMWLKSQQVLYQSICHASSYDLVDCVLLCFIFEVFGAPNEPLLYSHLHRCLLITVQQHLIYCQRGSYHPYHSLQALREMTYKVLTAIL